MRPVRLTKQGVRDLNGPAMDGRYNGRNSSTKCLHHTNPDYPVERREEMLTVKDLSAGFCDVRRVSVFYCAGCGARRWDELEDSDRLRVVPSSVAEGRIWPSMHSLQEVKP